MASTISLNDLAPADQTIHFTLATEEFDLGGSAKKSIKTDDADVIADAAAQPWLKVEADAAESAPNFVDSQVRPEDDAFSRFGPLAHLDNDPQAAADAEAAKLDAFVQPVALDAGKDQNVAVETAGVAETIAADDDATAAKSAAAFKKTDKAAIAAAASPSDSTSPDTEKDA